MASIQSRLLNFTTRTLMRFVFRNKKSIDGYRSAIARRDAARKQALPVGMTIEEVETPIRGRWLRNAQPRSTQTVLYLHGGAYCFRMVHGHSAMVASLCADAGVSAFIPWYRLAPEYPFPAAPEDSLAAYRYLLETGHDSKNIVIMGDSAGGNLALCLLHLIKQQALPMPSGVVTLSPITDAAQISATWRLNKYRDPLYVAQGAVNPAEWYFKGNNPLQPVISPYYGNFDGFPPMYFMVGSVEALLEDSVGMVRKAVDAGIPAKVQIWCGMPHVFPLMLVLPEARYARREIVKWLNEILEQRAPPRKEDLYRSCVEFIDMKPFTHRLIRETNDIFLEAWCSH